MGILENQCASLYDMQVSMNPDGSYENDVIEMLDKEHAFIRYMQWLHCNRATSHVSTIRVGLPKAYLAEYYGYVPSSKGEKMQVTDTCGRIISYSGVDIDLYNDSGKTEAERLKFRAEEDASHIESMNQELSRLVFYGNPKIDKNEFSGLTPRYSDRNAENWENVFDAGGLGSDNGSIWLIGWGKKALHGILPQGATSGIQHTNLKEQVETIKEDGVTKQRTLLKSRYVLAGGLAVRDWRYAVRICNIDKSELSNVFVNGEFKTGANLPSLMDDATTYIHSLSNVVPVFCMSRKMISMLGKQCSAATRESTLSIEKVGGMKIKTFQEIPILRTDVLAADEARV